MVLAMVLAMSDGALGKEFCRSSVLSCFVFFGGGAGCAGV